MISRGHGRLVHTKEYVLVCRFPLVDLLFMLFLTLNACVEWNMVQFIGPSRNYHVCDGLGPDDVFSGNRYVADRNRRYPRLSRDAVRTLSNNGAGVPRQNISDGSR